MPTASPAFGVTVTVVGPFAPDVGLYVNHVPEAIAEVQERTAQLEQLDTENVAVFTADPCW